MYSKKRQNGTLKTPSPPEPKKQTTAQRVQNQPLNLKRISSGKVIASVNVTKMKTPSPVKRDPRPTAPTPPPPRQTVPFRNRISSKEDFEPKSRVVSAPPPQGQSSPVKMTPTSSRPSQKLKSINLAGKHVVSVANVKCQKRAPPPSKPTPTPPPPPAPKPVEEKPKKPKVSKKTPPPPKPDNKESTAEDKSILVHRGKTIEQRLNMEFANKEREEKEKTQKTVETKDEDDSITVSQTEEDKQLNPDSSQYAPRTVSKIALIYILT